MVSKKRVKPASVGNLITIGQGAFEIVQGLAIAGGGGAATGFTAPACATGVGCIIPAATATVSAAGMIEAMHGAGVIGLTLYNVGNNQGPGSRSGWKATPENVERMKQGKAPVGNDGHSVELHHKGQKPDGKIVPLTRTDHRGKGNNAKNHPNRGPSKIDRGKFKTIKKNFWKDKARGK